MNGESIRPQPKPVKREPKARKPLKRSWTRKKTPRRVLRETPAEKFYKHWIHGEPCVCGCSKPAQQSHLRAMTGLGRKELNFSSIAQRADDHRDFTEGAGRFKGLSKLERFAWFMLRLAETHARFEEQHGCRPEDWKPANPQTHVS